MNGHEAVDGGILVECVAGVALGDSFLTSFAGTLAVADGVELVVSLLGGIGTVTGADEFVPVVVCPLKSVPTGGEELSRFGDSTPTSNVVDLVCLATDQVVVAVTAMLMADKDLAVRFVLAGGGEDGAGAGCAEGAVFGLVCVGKCSGGAGHITELSFGEVFVCEFMFDGGAIFELEAVLAKQGIILML